MKIGQTSPARNRVWSMLTKYRAATICVMNWIGPGMEFMSNTKPESIIAGRNVMTIAIWPATNWLSAVTDIFWPRPMAVSLNTAVHIESAQKEPLRGTSKSHMVMATESAIPPIPSKK